MSHFGLLNIDKPSGLTSRQVVDHVVRLVRPDKAGHAGTLDPLASGVLVVCVGPATRLIEYVQRMPKRYTGTFLLGRHSPTEDVEGEVTELPDPPRPSRDEIEQVAARLTGEILQRPPAFSALKVQGRRSYDLARAGRAVELEPRPVMIHRIGVLRYEYPELTLDIECGSGTYIRSLGRDLAEKLDTAAVMSALVRTAVGIFTLETTCRLEGLNRDTLDQHLLPPQQALEGLPKVVLSQHELTHIRQGLAIQPHETAAPGTELIAMDESGALAAILTVRPDGTLGPWRNFPPPR